mmetsp:Transcript_25318/g.35282  ORF Transcript_25318/g.35282 Transcript_25318/m.35282 type:complete len:223 (-) Transcript_25318:458-1126(-)
MEGKNFQYRRAVRKCAIHVSKLHTVLIQREIEGSDTHRARGKCIKSSGLLLPLRVCRHHRIFFIKAHFEVPAHSVDLHGRQSESLDELPYVLLIVKRHFRVWPLAAHEGQGRIMAVPRVRVGFRGGGSNPPFHPCIRTSLHLHLAAFFAAGSADVLLSIFQGGCMRHDGVPRRFTLAPRLLVSTPRGGNFLVNSGNFRKMLLRACAPPFDERVVRKLAHFEI